MSGHRGTIIKCQGTEVCGQNIGCPQRLMATHEHGVVAAQAYLVKAMGRAGWVSVGARGTCHMLADHRKPTGKR